MPIGIKHPSGVLLDTHIWIHLQSGTSALSKAVLNAIDRAAATQSVYVPVISVWEIGMLSAKRCVEFDRPIRDWVKAALDRPGIQALPLTTEVALEAALLPKSMHPDPADRIILATAMIEKLTLITRDRSLLAYAKSISLHCMEG